MKRLGERGEGTKKDRERKKGERALQRQKEGRERQTDRHTRTHKHTRAQGVRHTKRKRERERNWACAPSEQTGRLRLSPLLVSFFSFFTHSFRRAGACARHAQHYKLQDIAKLHAERASEEREREKKKPRRKNKNRREDAHWTNNVKHCYNIVVDGSLFASFFVVRVALLSLRTFNYVIQLPALPSRPVLATALHSGTGNCPCLCLCSFARRLLFPRSNSTAAMAEPTAKKPKEEETPAVTRFRGAHRSRRTRESRVTVQFSRSLARSLSPCGRH